MQVSDFVKVEYQSHTLYAYIEEITSTTTCYVQKVYKIDKRKGNRMDYHWKSKSLCVPGRVYTDGNHDT
jgi:hypothetical protein